MKLVSFALVSALAFAGCKKKEADAPASTTTQPTGSAAQGSADQGSAAAGSAAAPDQGSAAAAGSAAAPDAQGEYVTVLAMHKEPKPDDPVQVKFERFNVKTAKLADTANLEGATATIELDPSSISSGSPKRDDHLKSDSYIGLPKFALVTIDVSNVKKKADNQYAADAKVKFRDIEKTYPITFDVVETTADGVRVKAAHKFPRADFGIGKAPDDKDESVAGDLEIQLQLNLKKS